MKRQVAIIGTGWVGASVAISVLHSGVADVVLLNDLHQEIAVGEALDLAHGASFYPTAAVRTAAVEEMRDVDAIVIAAGRSSRPGESRLDLLKDNAAVIEGLGRQLGGGPGTIVIVTNPVDVLTRVVAEVSGRPRAQVLGTGTMLDTARLRHTLGRALSIDPHSVHAHVVGEHGDSEVVLWSAAHAAGLRLRDWPGWTRDREPVLADEVRRAAYEIIRRKGATNHAIGLATSVLLRSMLRDERRVLTVSRVQEGALGLKDVALSLPTVIGADGGTLVLEPEMNREEHQALEASAAVLENAFSSL